MEYQITRTKRCKNIWLNTTDCTIANTGTDASRRLFRFFTLPLIQIRKKSYLKVNSITLSSADHNLASGHNWTVKLRNVKYNGNDYFNSDKIAIPTIACFNYDTRHSVQNGLYTLQLEEQDINNLELEIYNEAGTGLIKSNTDINLHINLVIEEYEDYY